MMIMGVASHYQELYGDQSPRAGWMELCGSSYSVVEAPTGWE